MDECQHYVKEICAHIPVRYSPGAASCRIMPPRIGSRFSLVPRGRRLGLSLGHHAAVNWVQAQPAKRPARECLPPTSRRFVRELGAASCRRELDAGSVCQATCAGAFTPDEQEVRSRIGRGIMPPRLRPGSAHCGTKFSRKRAQLKASDLRENVKARQTGVDNAIATRHSLVPRGRNQGPHQTNT